MYMKLSEAEKKACKQRYKEKNRRRYVLTRPQVQALFDFLDTKLDDDPCDETLRFTVQWMAENLPQALQEAALQELREMGSYCDCEVFCNSYEAYGI